MAIPTWDDRVSPVFDVAGRVLVVDIDDNREVHRSEVLLDEPDVGRRVQRLAQLEVDSLICGAVSIALEAGLDAAGIKVIPQTCGFVDDVLRAFIAGRLTTTAFLMPGCRERRPARCRPKAGGGQAGLPRKAL